MTSQKGLSTPQARLNQKTYGLNQITSSRTQIWLSEALEFLKDPMMFMLLALSGIYFFLGQKDEALMMLLAILPILAVDILLERRSANALKKLQSQLKQTAFVIRDDKIQEIPTIEITIDDVLILEEGQNIPVDGKVLETKHLLLNESMLTGESIPVLKKENDEFFSGTIVNAGHALGLVTQIGSKTRLAQLSKLIEYAEGTYSPLQKKLEKIVKRIAIAAFILSLCILGIHLFQGSNIWESLIKALSFGMAAMPEEFPVVFTLYLSLGAWRLSRYGVLVKNLPSVESLGSVDIICTDKTGTLTQGKFQLEQATLIDNSNSLKQISLMARLACEKSPSDAMEQAILEYKYHDEAELVEWEHQMDYPFDKDGKHISHIWKQKSSNKLYLAMKGSVEGVVEHCNLNPEQKTQILTKTDELAKNGKRLLGLAYTEIDSKNSLLADQFHNEQNLKFLSILVFSDPIRESVPDAIKKCQQYGIQIKVLTGDHPETAKAIAKQAGIMHSEHLTHTGSALNQMSEQKKQEAYLSGIIFSRLTPEQKYELLKTLQDNSNVVAMTGDGINDAPALKKADIGISMGENASDIARSSADMILLHNDFSGIVESIIEGRKIFKNLQRSFSYLIAFHIPLILLSFWPLAFNLKEILMPKHIVLLELLVHPISAFAFENLNSKSSQKNTNLLNSKIWISSSLQGLFVGIVSFSVFLYLEHQSHLLARSWALMLVLIGNMFFVLIESWDARSKKLYLVLSILMLLTASCYFFKPLQDFLEIAF